MRNTFMRMAAMLAALLLAGAGAMATPAPKGKVWTCRNGDFEISCAAGKCRAAEGGGFTPMAVTLDERGRLAVCAYSGCWEGAAKIVRRGQFRVFTALRLAWSHPSTGPGAADFAAILDTADRVAVLKGAGYAHPLTCE